MTATGAATYTIPIALPRGSGGLTPSVALVYNSQSGSGAAGWGWTLAGLSAITRCPKTIDDDNVTQAVQLQSTDDFCLDGQKLLQKPDGTYDTELQQFSQITSHVVTGDSGGPSYWTVETKNGTTYEYGYTTGSTGARIYATNPSGGAETVVRVWALDKVTDANTNYYTITYQNNDTTTGDFWPLSIQYSGNNNKPSYPDHTVTFKWTPRSDESVRTSFVAGTVVAQTQLLSSISVSYNSTTAITYYLTYQTDSNTLRNQLTQVEECALDTSGSCFSPTLIGWQPGGAPGWQSATPVSGVSGLTYDQVLSTHLVDVNGDGIADLLYPGSSDWMVLFGQAGGGFGSPVNTGVPIGSNSLWTLATDANGDGRMDLMVPGTSTWTVYKATGDTSGTIFNAVATGLSDSGTNSLTGAPIYEGNAALADYSGRGLGDFLYSDGTNIYLVPNNGPTSNPQYGSPQNMGALGNLSNDVVTHQGVFSGAPLDFDGSGRGGRLSLTITTYTSQCNPQDQPGCTPGSTTKYAWWPLLSTPSGYAATLGSLVCWSATMTPLPLDATGGGLTDLLYSCPATNVYDLELSTGTGLKAISTAIPYTGTDPVLADYYGDGREEVLTQDSGYSSGWALIRMNYDPPTASFVAAVSAEPSAPLPSNYVQGSLQVGSIEAGGRDDLVFAELSGSTYSLYYELHNQPSPSTAVADTVTRITDGLGNSYTPSYATLTDTSAYTEGSGAVYPVQDVKAPIAVVTSYSENDGIGGNYTISFSYANGKQEVTGRGFLGFGNRSVTDSRNGVTAKDNYAQTYPWIGALTSESVTQSNGDVLSSTTNTYAPSAGCAGGVLCFPYLSQSVVTQNDTSGNPLRTITTANNSVDSYGDVLTRTVTVVDKTSGPTNGQTFTTETQTGYANDASSGAYCIDLPISVSVTKTTPAGSLTRSSVSPQDTSACRSQSVTLNQGGSPTLETQYAYDSYGNPATVTVSGTLLTTRSTTTDYATYNGEYPDKITNALNQVTTETWDPARGVELTATDPNGHTTSFGYDGFGRKTSESRPSGLTLGWLYDACGASVNGQVLGSPANCAYAVGETSNAQSLPIAATLYDSKGRAIQAETWLLGNAVSTVVTHYDALGRATAVSKPYLSGASNEY
ncbi:MAG: VCBS repeat-containing protein, partial [Gammaproteobacteria bacterium]|nr:VCBS repeat-containing protein [Gammaproteobacteria bacterium]